MLLRGKEGILDVKLLWFVQSKVTASQLFSRIREASGV